jgi:hypothetical protein
MAWRGNEAAREPNGQRDWGRRESDDPTLPEDERVVPGRRRSDYDPRLTISRKAVVVLVVIIDSLYLAGQVILVGQSSCL